MITCYRADKRPFQIGERIKTAGEYYSLFPEPLKVIEDILDATRPAGKLRRTSCLFLFEELEAGKHWSKMAGGRLYQVEAADDDVVHRGDMALMDVMKQAALEGREMLPIAQAYWEGRSSPMPEMELLVNTATVVEVLSASDAERRGYLRQRWTGVPAV